MKNRILAAAVSALVLASCGAGGSESSAPPPIGSAPTPSSSPSPTSTPTPTASYKTYAELTGDQRFKTACAAFNLSSIPVSTTEATEYGAGLNLSYVASTQTYTIDGNGIFATYGPADHNPAAPADAQAYLKIVNGLQETFSIGAPAPAIPLDYVRRFSLFTRLGSAYQQLCVFGVPTLVSDAPAATTSSFTRSIVGGSAYRIAPTGGSLALYSLEASTVTFHVDLVTGATTGSINLIGTLRTAAGAGPQAEFGTYNLAGTIDPELGSYSGALTVPGSPFITGSFGGWFFGPQGREAGYAFSIRNQSAAGSDVMAGTVVIAR